MSEYRNYLIKLSKQARKEYIEYSYMSKEQQKEYELTINYERDKIVCNSLYECPSYVYLLYDPSSISKTCYVGITKDVEARLEKHANDWDTLSKNNNKKSWVKSMRERNIEPAVLVMETVETNGMWHIAESFHIAYFKYIGIKLCNGTLGGDGNPGYKASPETLKKYAATRTGMVMSERFCEAHMRQDVLKDMAEIIDLYQNKQYSLNEIALLYETGHDTIKNALVWADIAIRDEKFTDRSIDKLRQANIGKIQSAETIEKRIAPLRGIERDPEIGAKISITRKEKINNGVIIMPTNRASGNNSGNYRVDVDTDYLIELRQQGKSYREIGRIVNMEHHAVKQRLIDVHFEKDEPDQLNNFVFDTEQALKLFADNYSCNAIGKIMNTDGKTIKRYLEKAGIIFDESKYVSPTIDLSKAIEMFDNGKTYTEIAVIFNTSSTTIKNHLAKTGRIKNQKRIDENEIMDMWAKNMNMEQIAKQLNTSGGVVKKYLERNGIVFDKSKYGKIVLNNDEIMKIYSETQSLKETAKRLSTTANTIKSRLSNMGIDTDKQEIGADIVDKIIKLYSANNSVATIADIFDLNPKTITKYLKLNNIKMRATNKDINEEQIKKYMDEGLSINKIAKNMNVSHHTIKKLIKIEQ